MMKSFPLSVLSLASLTLGLNSAPAASPGRWVLDSFRGFSEGTFEDGGANSYVTADGTVRMINAFDLNGDGLPDVFLPCTHGYSEVTDLSIYRDQPGYDTAHVTKLPTNGGKDAAVADLNRDGFPDLVVANNFNGTRNDLEAFIYWGAADGYSAARRSMLPTQGSEAVEIADLNGDGWPEIIFANSGLTYHMAVDQNQQSYVYWNDAGKFSPERRLLLPTINGRDVAVGDLNGDGAPDIVLVSAGNEPNEAGARIYWSHDGSYDVAHSVFLQGEGSTAVTLADLNRDGRLDLVLVNGQRLSGRENGIYNLVDTVQIDSFIFWNSPNGFHADRRTGLPTVAGFDAAAADLDGDGWPDLVFANGEGGASFIYWGSAEGFQGRRRLALPTNHAHAVRAVDLNGDRHPELVFANFSVGSNFDTDSFIYWGGENGFDVRRRQGIPTSGASAIVVADLKKQGRSDLIFINKQSGIGADDPSTLYLSDRKLPEIFSPARRIDVETSESNAYSAADLNLDGKPDLIIPGAEGASIYWADGHSYSRKNRTLITSNYSMSARLADFNRDGYLDAVLSEWHPGSKATHVYYGGPGGFSSAASVTLPVGGIRFHTIGDFNNDGWLDVAFPIFGEDKIAIFWNSASGFRSDNRTDLPGRAAVALEVADLNRDGFLDLIAPNLFDNHPPAETAVRAFGGSPDGGVFIYWGSAQGYSEARRTLLPAIGAEDVAVCDLNRDGRLDLVVTSYHGGTSRAFPSYVYWQGKDGFEAANVTMLETYSASGVIATDFNADGWPDLLFSNHQKNGSHRNDSFLYWGGSQGFSPERRLSLPANGPHLMTVCDPGNIFDRRPQAAYLSPAKELSSAKTLNAIAWTADTPPGTAVSLQVRSARTAELLTSAKWEGPRGIDSEFETPAAGISSDLHGPWVQFRAVLKNPGGGLPVLRSVALDFK